MLQQTVRLKKKLRELFDCPSYFETSHSNYYQQRDSTLHARNSPADYRSQAGE
jgi:hypothetical protein